MYIDGPSPSAHISLFKCAAPTTPYCERCSRIASLAKGFQTNTEVVHVSAFFSRCGTPQPSNLAVNRDDVNQGSAGA